MASLKGRTGREDLDALLSAEFLARRLLVSEERASLSSPASIALFGGLVSFFFGAEVCVRVMMGRAWWRFAE